MMQSINTAPLRDDYLVLRYLFHEALESSITDKRWHLAATQTEPGYVMMTEYVHRLTGDRIRCASRDFNNSTGEYTAHQFTFTRKTS